MTAMAAESKANTPATEDEEALDASTTTTTTEDTEDGEAFEASTSAARSPGKERGGGRRHPLSLLSGLGAAVRGGLLLLGRWLRLGWLLAGIGSPPAKQEPAGLPSTKRKLGELDLSRPELEKPEQELKKWHGDPVYSAIQDFVAKMWGATDNNDNVTLLQTDETRAEQVVAGKGTFWKKEPEMNFVKNKVKVKFGGDGTPSRTIQDLNENEEVELVEVEDSPAMMSFADKQVFFAKEIAMKKVEAEKGGTVTEDDVSK